MIWRPPACDFFRFCALPAYLFGPLAGRSLGKVIECPAHFQDSETFN
jgi:hypothetical protein